MANDILERLRHRVDVFSKFKSQAEFWEITYLTLKNSNRNAMEQRVKAQCKNLLLSIKQVREEMDKVYD